MAGSINIAAYSDALVVLGTAGVVVPMVQRLGISPVLGYLAAGALLGPLGLGSFISTVPVLRWFTVTDAKNVAGIADLGVVFLLFLIGLELSLERLRTMRRLVFGLGALQVAITTAVIASGLALVGGFTPAVSVLLGGCLALSSTAIVIELLSKQGRLTTATGRMSFSILLAQDLAVIPILMFISIVGGDDSRPLWTTAAIALLQAVLAVALIVLVGRLVLRPLFRSVAHTNSSELFIAAILFVIVLTGVFAAEAGLSMALGAFVAGLLLAETEYSRAVEATIEPFKSLLLGLFFFTVGMTIDFREVARDPVLLLACVAGLILLKTIVVAALCRLFHASWPTAIEAGLLLGPGGEFAFVGVSLATMLLVISPSIAAFTVAVTSLSMALIPVLAAAGVRIRTLAEHSQPPEAALLLAPPALSRHAIVIGYGRVGRVVTEMLKEHHVPFTAIDHSSRTVMAARSKGEHVYFGDATNANLLMACGIESASGVVLTLHTQAGIDEIVRQVRALRPDVPIVARARDADHARQLYALGVTDAVPETIEASLQVSEAALVGLGLAAGPIIASIHQKRDNFRAELQEAARKSGAQETRSIRAKAVGVEGATSQASDQKTG